MRWARVRHRRQVADVVDVDDETIDLRVSDDEYHCVTIHLGVPAVRDDAAEAWEEAGSLVEYPLDLEEWRADRRREDLEPGHLSAAVLQADEIDPRE